MKKLTPEQIKHWLTGYTVTRQGLVYSKMKGSSPLHQRMDGGRNGLGYPSVDLWQDGKRKHIAVYRLVATLYLPPRPTPHHFICHKDGNHMNSRATNLYWGTCSENGFDAWVHRREREALAA